MRNPQPICSCPKQGEYMAHDENRKEEQMGDGVEIFLGGSHAAAASRKDF
jgi:hypothetical protein